MQPRRDDPGTEPLPAPQRLYDSIFLLMAAGIAVMAILYTGWGLWEILTLHPAPLP